MKHYYQYNALGVINAYVKSSVKPVIARQFAVDTPLDDGPKRYAKLAKEVVYYKHEYDDDGEYVRTVEDTDKSRTKIGG